MPEPSWLSNSNPSDAAPSGEAPSSSSDNTPRGDEGATLTLGDGSNLSDALSESNQPPADTQAGEQGDAEKKGTKSGEESGDESGYSAFTLPEGLQISEAHQAALTEYGKQYNLPQEGVQRVVDLGVEIAQMTREAVEAESQVAVEQMHAQWRKDLMADPELGGQKLKETQANLDAFQRSEMADPGLLKFLNETSLVLNPHVARLLSRIGASFKETPVHLGGGANPAADRNVDREIFNNSGHV